MSFSDHGKNVDVETISNQSGDTLLLTDDDSNVWTYADILQRENSSSLVRNAPGSQAASYLGRGRHLTDFERANFAIDNITPCRPCMAYFSAGHFVDSKSVFDKLGEMGIPRESVVCLQRRPSRDMLITFIDEETKNKFVSCVSIRFRDSTSAINDEDMPLTYLNIYDAPEELSDDALKLRLDKYCTVFSARRGKFSNSHVYKGIRHYRVHVKNPIPSYLRFGKFLVRLSHDGQQHTCRRCNRAGHFANECQNTVCFNCEELGHVSRDCEEEIRCCIWKSTEHFARRCPYSWYQAPPPPQVPDPSSTENATHSATGNAADNVAEDVVEEIPAGDSSGSPVGDSVPLDNLSRDRVSPQDPDNPDPSLGDGSSGQPSVLSSDEHLLDSQGFIWEQIANRMREQGLAPNPPGLQSSPSPAESPDVDAMNPDLTQPALDVQPPDNSPPDVSMNSTPPVPPVPPDGPAQASPSPDASPVLGKSSKSVQSSRRKPAPLPAALEALGRKPTRPSLPVSGRKSSSVDPPPPPPSHDRSEPEDMDTLVYTSLKRKQELRAKKAGPKKGKH